MTKTTEPIAIVGISCRFPGGAVSPSIFWDHLIAGRDLVTEVSKDRWNTDYFLHPRRNEPGKSYTFAAGVLDNYKDFDAAFFGVSPREAEQMDPQQRLMLELVWEALEDGHIRPSEIAGRNVGVYVGVSAADFASSRSDDPSSANAYFMTGSALSIVSNRISYVYDLKGPSMSIDTACSSSLVAMHQACESLRRGETDMVVCGGVNILMSPHPFAGFSHASMLSPEGRCKAFDDSGRGYVRAEGGAVVLLKPLSEAVAAGDKIHAVVKGTGLNSDGRTTGIALPNTHAQEALLRRVYAAAGIPLSEVDYVEAHGTGTMAGDPQEAGAIGRAIGATRATDNPLPIGSVKTNIGHLESGAGMAGLMKSVMVLKHREVPPSLHFKIPNVNIPFDEYGLKVVTEPLVLDAGGRPLVVGINSFGFGGTNSHVVLQEYQPLTQRSPVRRRLPAKVPPVFLSARSKESLAKRATQFAEILDGAGKGTFYDVAWTASHVRDRLEHRLVVRGADAETIIDRLRAFGRDGKAEGAVAGQVVAKDPKIAFVFSGNGSQWGGMGRELLAADPIFRRAVGKVDTLFKKRAGWSIIDVLLADDIDDRLEFTEVAQPTLFALQVGLLEVLEQRGVHPAAVVGHSVGEVAAAYACGALSLSQAVRVIFERSAAQGETKGAGRMAAAGLTPEAAASAIAPFDGQVEIAAVNSPESVTLSGPLPLLEQLGKALVEKEVFYRILDLDYPFHSRAMDPIQNGLFARLKGLKPGASEVPFVSTVAGETVAGESLDATYWWENIRKPVQFGPALSHLIGLEATVFVEIGPHAIMQMYVREALRAAGKPGQPVGLLKRGDAEVERLEDGIAALHAAGAQEDLSWAFPLPGNIQDLPAYPWHRQTHWFDSTVEKQGYLHSESFHPLLGFQSETNEFMWENDLDVARLPFLSDHKVDGAVVFPAAGFVEMALAAAAQHHGDGEQMVFDLEIRRPLVLEEDSGKSVRFLLSADDGTFAIESRERLSADPWTQNVVGRFGGHVQVSGPGKDRMEPGAGGKAISATAHYDLALSLGLDYGPAFQAVSAVHVADREAFGQFTCPEAIAEDFESYFLHPSFLDGAFQMLFDILSDHIDTQDGGSYLPSRFGKLRLFQPGMAIAAARVSLRRVAPRSVVADMRLVDSDGETVADLVDCRFRRFETRRHGTKRHPLYQFRYEPTPHLGGRRASPVPPTDVIAAEVAAQLPVRISEISRDGGLESVLSLFDALAASIAFETVRGFRIPEFTLKSLMHMGRVDSAFGPQLAYLISILEEDGLLVTDGDTYRLLDGSDLPPPEEIWRLILADYPAYLPEMVLAGRCARHMPAILRGSVAPDSIVSSRAGGGTLEHYFEDSGTVRAANLAAEMVIDQIVADWPSDRRLRILEIGGGTGGLASRVIDSLPSDRCDYVFTDESDEAVGHAEAHFKDSVFVSCRTLDISQDFADQGFEEAAFDIVIVGNILHRLSDMGAALGRVRGLLAERGLLLLAERMPERLTDMIFGSKPSWWRHTEDPWHPISSLMTPDKWVELLGKAGFEAPVAVSDGAEETAGLSYLVLARGGAAQSRSATETQSRWLILSDAAGSSAEIADSAAATLRLAGHEAICARPGKPTPKQALAFDPLIPADVARLLADVGDVSGIVHLVGFANGGTGQGESVDTIMDLEDRRCGSLLHLVQALERLGGATRPQLCVATGGAQGARPVEGLPWGLVRVLMNEQPGLNSRLIDLQDQPDTGKAGRILADELRFYDGEDEVILSGDARIVPRLDDAVLPTAEGDEASLESIRLDFSQPGPLSHLSWGEVTRRPPGEGEIEIEVRATGLNFRDVMWAMGMLPDEAVENGFAGASLGMECAGVVVNVGPGVRHFRVGDEVLAFAPSCFGSHVTTATTAVAPKPSALAFEEAATIPSAFFTAYYALGHLAQLRAGEKVLIHGAAGGVGIAAIQYAAYCGAEIFATAGSDEKRDFLRMLGVDHVLDSRSLAFADEIREITGG
ncbi:MAG: beta-ketoacyl synthase N-terminal-like domain-containing protein, partial [Magnetospiraceae bacterium]